MNSESVVATDTRLFQCLIIQKKKLCQPKGTKVIGGRFIEVHYDEGIEKLVKHDTFNVWFMPLPF